MSKRLRANVECCVCIRHADKNSQSITGKYAKSQKETIYDVLQNLNLLFYEVINLEEKVVCDSCKTAAIDFFKFRMMCESQQSAHKECAKKKEQDDEQIRDPLNSKHYEMLKDFLRKFPHSSIAIDDDNKLIITPSIKNEDDQISFIDFERADIKTEYDDDDEQQNVDDIGRHSSEAESDSESESFEKEISAEEEQSLEEDGAEDGVNKYVLNNVEFISRTPECLVDAAKKKNASSSASKVRNPENWIRIKQRTARACGQAYVSRSGKLIRAREMKAACNSCRYKCCEKISESERLKNFQHYWNLGDFILQRKFLFQHRVVEPVARRRARHENPRNRAYSTKYFLDTYEEDGTIREMVKVCETMFTNTLDICKNTIRTLQKKVETGKVEDCRGRQQRKLSPGHLVAVEHIKQFPYFHIERPMPLTQMYKLYVQQCTEKDVEPVKSGTYRKLFSDNNECEFLRQNNKIKCAVCDGYNQAASECERLSLEFDYQNHLETHPKCKQRARWRKSGKLKAERKRLMQNAQIV